MSAFLKASRLKLRFRTTKGELSVEDLWDLSLTSLDSIAVSIDSQLGSKKTFLVEPDRAVSSEQQLDQLRLEILKEVLSTKQAENAAARERSKRQAQLAFLKQLREDREIESLKSQPLDEINKQIAELEAEVS